MLVDNTGTKRRWTNDDLWIDEEHPPRETIDQLKAELQTPNPKLQTYPVMEHFYTLQGEGMYSGQAAYFIRLGGCDVGCVWCDVKESWDAEAHPTMSVASIVTAASAY